VRRWSEISKQRQRRSLEISLTMGIRYGMMPYRTGASMRWSSTWWERLWFRLAMLRREWLFETRGPYATVDDAVAASPKMLTLPLSLYSDRPFGPVYVKAAKRDWRADARYRKGRS
jgi:hypothetical protein